MTSMVIKLVRHGESLASVIGADQVSLAHYQNHLTAQGVAQAREAGAEL
jgi:broad specificity phosphatase PhoE